MTVTCVFPLFGINIFINDESIIKRMQQLGI